jgi:hypothetical protein
MEIRRVRELFLPRMEGKNQAVIKLLKGLNEIHHTIANWLVKYTVDQTKAFPIKVLCEQLQQIEDEFSLQWFLTPAIGAARQFDIGSSGNS